MTNSWSRLRRGMNLKSHVSWVSRFSSMCRIQTKYCSLCRLTTTANMLQWSHRKELGQPVVAAVSLLLVAICSHQSYHSNLRHLFCTHHIAIVRHCSSIYCLSVFCVVLCLLMVSLTSKRWTIMMLSIIALATIVLVQNALSLSSS